MTSASAIALTGMIAWSLLLLILMEILRTHLVLTKQVSANAFTPDNASLSPFMQRLARAHANTVEGLPIFGGLILVAMLSGQTAITDPLAYLMLLSRLVQSGIHLASLSVAAVTLRFTFFAIQLVIAAYWSLQLLVTLTSL